MKIKGIAAVLAVVVLDITAAVTVIRSNIDTSAGEYKTAVAAAQKYEEQNLCDKAIEKYYYACSIEDSVELREKIAELYEKGYENGEFSSLEGRNSVLDSMVSDYPDYEQSYDTLIDYYYNEENYTACADYVRAARQNGVETKKVKECYEEIRHMYTESNSGYENIESFGVYLRGSKASQDEQQSGCTDYTYLFDDGTMSDVYTAIDMSPPADVSFGEDESHIMYFSKTYGNSSENKIYSCIIKDGVRQCYLGENNEYEAVGPFSSGMLTLKNTKTRKYELFNTSGECLLKDYDYLGCFSNSLMYTQKGSEKKVIDTSNRSVFSEGIEEVVLGYGERCSINNRMFVKFSGDDKYTMVNSEDFSKFNFKCDNADLFIGEAAAFEENGKWGFVNLNGEVVISPKYEQAKSFSNGFAAVKQDGKWGYIDKSGEMIIEAKYDKALYFNSAAVAYAYTKDEGWKSIKVFYTE